jgi:hypothetical protein
MTYLTSAIRRCRPSILFKACQDLTENTVPGHRRITGSQCPAFQCHLATEHVPSVMRGTWQAPNIDQTDATW